MRHFNPAFAKICLHKNKIQKKIKSKMQQQAFQGALKVTDALESQRKNKVSEGCQSSPMHVNQSKCSVKTTLFTKDLKVL